VLIWLDTSCCIRLEHSPFQVFLRCLAVVTSAPSSRLATAASGKNVKFIEIFESSIKRKRYFAVRVALLGRCAGTRWEITQKKKTRKFLIFNFLGSKSHQFIVHNSYYQIMIIIFNSIVDFVSSPLSPRRRKRRVARRSLATNTPFTLWPLVVFVCNFIILVLPTFAADLRCRPRPPPDSRTVNETQQLEKPRHSDPGLW
jgi:hypothetical protein